MPIAFRDAESIEELGVAAYLEFVMPRASEQTPGAANSAIFGALLLLNARGEPLEFVYNRLELLSEPLWRPADRALAGQRRLAASLFAATTLSPALLLCRAAVVPPPLFDAAESLALTIPVGRVASASERLLPAAEENLLRVETFDENGEMQNAAVAWRRQEAQSCEAPQLPLWPLLIERGLVLEPFARLRAGLREVYGELLEAP